MSDEIHVDNVSMSSENQSFQCTQLITKALDEKGWKYDIRLHDGDTERDRIYLSFNADNLPTIRVLIVCDEHGRRVSLYVYDIVKLPHAEPAELYKLIQTMHFNFIFARWMFDENDKTLQAEWYTHMNDTMDSARVVATGVGRLASLVDEAYPLVMKTCGELGLFK
ncbi:MAG: hypothetical protein IJZ68_07480 [Bacteroidaceae bacterium]|nr:hypothetical protein [Bacteroidaceae bacterium]